MSSYSAFSGLPLPAWQDFTPSTQGISSEVVNWARYLQFGPMVFVQYFVSGTSTATTKSFTLPVSCSVEAAAWAAAQDNGVNLTSPSMAVPSFSDGSHCSLFKDASFGAWTASGSWDTISEFWYETG